ncbi:O-antigen ligase family protein [Pukyongia salina]|uniref:O-antigen ligase family protein n=1 Tax=Pukyongia salina TaxID=2094025 RepID=UPI00131A25A1|nr:O-antigen ligase family protein [Pukyongia salina]
MNKLEKGLIFAGILIPFTVLRVGYVGLGELTLLILFLYGLNKGYINRITRDVVFSRFWVQFLIITFFGFAYNIVILNQSTGTVESTVFDFMAYIVILITCLIIENFYHKDRINIYEIIKRIFLISGVLFTALYLVSMFTDTIYGLPLKYYDYFAPFVTNLHQTAMFMAPMPFIGLLIFRNEKRPITRFISLVLILIFSYLVVQTGSFKALVGLTLGWAVYFVLEFVKLFKGRMKNAVIVSLISIIIILGVVNSPVLYEIFFAIFNAEDLASGRSSLYSNAIDVALTSPLVGLGPGAHIYQAGQFWDSHETFITVFLQGGAIGLVFFLILLYKIFKTFTKVTSLLAASIPILIYALGGDIMRRLPIWLLLMLLYYYIINYSKEAEV